MEGFPTKDDYNSELLMLSESMIEYIGTALEVGDLGGEQAKVKVQVENGVLEFVYGLETSKNSDRERNDEV